MTDLQPENKAFYRSTLLLRGLYASGLKHVVVSPGSRSTPLTLAAAAFPDLQKHVILDERSAAFFALGIGKSTGQPAALICTSGTAVANYFPAVIEARMSGVPLLLLTADRPANLLHTGANQTINQQHIFGDYPVFFDDLDEPEMDDKNIDKLKKSAQKAFTYSQSRKGPLHLNIPFSKPLEPGKAFLKKTAEANKNITVKSGSGSPEKQYNHHRFEQSILDKINASHSPLFIVGQLTPSITSNSIYKLADALQAPVLSEEGIGNKKCNIQGFEGFLRNENNLWKLEPDLIIRFGIQPASKSLLQAIKKWNPKRHIYIADAERTSNIEDTTTDVLSWNGEPFDVSKLSAKSTDWLQSWKETEQTFFEKSATVLDQNSTLTDGHIYHHIAPSIPEHWSVFISNSFPARDHSMFGRWRSQKVFTNRGASGIDGITSTAMGVNAGLHQPGILFTGDLAFLHDTNALLNAKELEQPLVVMVINNGGGSIFRMLPIAEHNDHFNTYFETPQQADITALAQSYRLNTQKIEMVNELKQLDLKNIIASSGSRLHIIECKTDADASMEVRNNLWDTAL